MIQLINKSENSDLYSDIFSIVEEESKNIEVTSYGTIGSYFKGCITSTSFPGNPSCSLICMDALKPPGEGWYSCRETLINANWNESYSFEIIREGEDIGYIYLNNNNFTGFTEKEKRELNKHIKTCKILKKSADGKYYHDVLGGFYTLDQIPSRVDNDSFFSTSYSYIFYIVIFVILIVLILYGLYKMNDKKE